MNVLSWVRRWFAPPAAERIHVAMIEHRHGANFYAAETSERLDEQIAGYVDDFWEHELPGLPQPEDPDATIKDYFAGVPGEYLTRGTVLLVRGLT